MPGKIIAGIIDGKTAGHYVLRTMWNARSEWDRDQRKWVGRVESKLCRPELVCWHPDCETPDDSPWVIEFERMRLDDAIREGGGAATLGICAGAGASCRTLVAAGRRDVLDTGSA